MSAKALYERVLGDQFSLLPTPVQQMHLVQKHLLASGSCTVMQGSHPLSRIVSWYFGFPKSGFTLPIKVNIIVQGGAEKWSRQIGEAMFSSHLTEGVFQSGRCLIEKFGFVIFYFSLPVTQNGLSMKLLRVTVLGISMPKWCWPIVNATETIKNNKFYFDVRVDLARFGMLTHYQGYLDIEKQN